MAISELEKVFKEAQAKAADVANELKAAYAKEKDTLAYEISILKRDEMDKVEAEKKAKTAETDEYCKRKNKEADEYYKVKMEELKQHGRGLNERELLISEKEEEIKAIPLLKEEIKYLHNKVADKAVAYNSMVKDYEYKAKLAESEMIGELNLRNHAIQELEKKVNALEALNESLEEKLEMAYNRITEMANNTSQSSSKDATIAALKEVAATGKNNSGK